MITIKRLDHIQICIPFGKEQEARAFYSNILNFKEILKPKELIKNGGLWYDVGKIELHIGCEHQTSSSKSHPAFEVENINLLKKHLDKNNVKINENIPIPNCERFFIIDPFNNKIEFLEKTKVNSTQVIEFWQRFVLENKNYEFYSIPATDFFCNEETVTNQLAQLVKNDIKTATCGALIDYQITKTPIPKQNDLTIIVDWHKNPICIIKTKSVTIRKFKEVDSDFAKKEGEGDKSLEYWKQVHKTFFSDYLKTIGVEFTEDIDLFCEEFERIG